MVYSSTSLVQQAIERQPLVVTPDCQVTEAIARMHQARTSCVLVHADKRLIGLMSERDVVRITAAGLDISEMAIATCMTTNLITLQESEIQDIFSALNLMRQHHIRHLPVINASAQIVGLITPYSIRASLQPKDLLRFRQVKEVMQSQVIYAEPNASILHLAQRMAQTQMSCIIIAETKGDQVHPVGIITERDIVQFQVLNLDLAHMPATTVMSSPLLPVHPDDSLWAAHQMMQRHHIRRLVVKGEQGELPALITQTDLLRVFDPTEMYSVIQVLQQTVEARTHALESANQKLQAQIQTSERLSIELQMALTQEKELHQLKSRFVSMVSHEFRTPLTRIRLSADLLSKFGTRQSEETKQRYLQQIRTGVDQMNQLMTDVLLLSRIEAGKLDIQPESINLTQFCQNLIDDMQFLASDRHQLQFQAQSTTALLPDLACLDETLISHILANLVSNAIKYSPEGGPVQVTLTYSPRQVQLCVQDQGIGIPAKDQPHLFESFCRASNVGLIEGTGLGLNIVKQCIDRHGGQIQVESQEGIGTSFTVTLPLFPQDADAVTVENAASS